MKERLTLSDLANYFANHMVNRIIYSTENQQSMNDVSQTLIFNHLLTTIHPNQICLKGDQNTMCFHGVQCVYIDPERSVLGTILDVECDGSSGEKIYTLILQ